MQEKLISSEKQPLFELYAERPAHWSPAEDVMVSEALGATDSTGKNNFVYKQTELFATQIVSIESFNERF